MKDVQQEMQQLTEQLLYHARRYYNEDAPEISDFEYDKMQCRLRELEAQYPQFASSLLNLLRTAEKTLEN